ncbi:class I SAM-dependent methyltransferase [Candidatus Peregrinibacteria bacterium]|jgi:ubiquinone/menaquinone biosynthesis C-methylase UbiE|nr:class I SAM-dependent methyltransferase [Candidatus Peregrinibacteria bacterium]
MPIETKILAILFIIAVILLIPVFIAGFSLAPWVPIPKDRLEKINRLANLKPGQIFYELGCGDARVAHYIAKANPKAKVIGIEMAYTMYLWSRLRNFISPQKNLTLKHANALKVDLSDANIVYIYMIEPTMNKILKPKFLRELKKNTKIISYACRFLEWDGPYTCEERTKKSKSLHVYTITSQQKI